MINPANVAKNRRKFLQYLAASPVLAMSAREALANTAFELQTRPDDPYIWKPFDPNYIVTKPEDALDVFELEAVAHKNIPGAHWGYMSTGADGENSYRANRQDQNKFVIRSRRLIDVRNADTSREMFGHKYDMPFFLCPVGRLTTYHPDAETGASRAAGRHNIAQGLATNTTIPTEQANKLRGHSPVMFQLYQQANWEITKLIVQRAERSGCKAMLVTVDGTGNRKLASLERARRDDNRLCVTCHAVSKTNPKQTLRDPGGMSMFSEVPAEMWEERTARDAVTAEVSRDTLTWEFIKRLRDITKMEIFIKGIMDVEDALLCVKYGYGVHVSNHGGRNEDTGGSTIASLADIAPAVKGRVPIFVDGGFYRGFDIVKALAMGATMVGFGRPYLWGLGAFGEAGVDRVIQIVKAEFNAALRQVGATSLKDLHRGMIHKAL
jgi:isopentenyl diphosphate isomerase/L-lactate dehydrogenase-like FMN-dependent dehydrogenase